jgi:hypothetical protein
MFGYGIVNRPDDQENSLDESIIDSHKYKQKQDPVLAFTFLFQVCVCEKGTLI